MCSVLPEDKQGPVLDDIRKISKETRRQWCAATRITAASAARPSAADVGLAGVYRSISELSPVPAAAHTTSADDDVHFPPASMSLAGSLLATVRAARSRQSMSATVVYNPAFYDAPVAYVAPNSELRLSTAANNPARQPYLYMTPENGFSLQRPPSPADVEPTTQL